MLEKHILVLVVTIPLFLTVLGLWIRSAFFSWLYTLFVSFLSFVLSIICLKLVYDIKHSLSYTMGGWLIPYGIEYRLDELGALFLVLVCFMSFVSILYAKNITYLDVKENMFKYFDFLSLISMVGSIGIIITGDLFNLFVFLEIVSLSSYAVIAMGRNNNAALTAFNYLIIGTIGASFYVIGVGLLFITTGTLNMIDMYNRLSGVGNMNIVAVTGIVLVFISAMVKLAIFPFYGWLIRVYRFSPIASVVFMSATSAKIALYIFIRLYITVFNVDDYFIGIINNILAVILFLAFIGIILGSVGAVLMQRLRLILSYSSVANIGYMVVGVCLIIYDVELGITAGILVALNHGLAKSALFMATGRFEIATGDDSLVGVKGIASKMPFTAGVVVFSGLSLIGFPGTFGFIAKFFLIKSIIIAEAWFSLAFIIVGTMLSIIYVWRVVELMYFAVPEKDFRDNRKNSSITEIISLVIVSGLIFLLGLFPSPIIFLAEHASYDTSKELAIPIMNENHNKYQLNILSAKDGE